MINNAQIPRWMEVLIGEKFYEGCLVHESERKNLLCLECCIAVCPHCLDPHLSHHLLQIRRYIHKDVIRLEDAEKLLNCSSIQSYFTNRANVVFLRHRPQPRPSRTSGNVCVTCSRCLKQSFFFCSIFCKVTQLLKTGVVATLSGSSAHDSGQMISDSVVVAEPSGLSVGQTGSGPVLSHAASTNRRKKNFTPCRSPMY